MSAHPENTFIAAVHRHLLHDLYRQKNHNQYIGGIADVWYSGVNDLWIEYKFVSVPKRDDTTIDLINSKGKKDSAISSLQQEWLKGRHAEGRQVGVIVGCKEGGVWFPGVSWNCTYTAQWFRSQLLSRKELADLIVRLTSGRKIS